MHHRCQAVELTAAEPLCPRGTSNSERTQTVKGGKGEAAIHRTLCSHSAPPVSARLCIAAVRCSDRAIQVSPIAPLLQPQQPVSGVGRSTLPLTPLFRSRLCIGRRGEWRSIRVSTHASAGGGIDSRRDAVNGAHSHIRG